MGTRSLWRGQGVCIFKSQLGNRGGKYVVCRIADSSAWLRVNGEVIRGLCS